MNTPELRWYVASFADRDTHKGVYSPASQSVHAVCGAEFVPLTIGWPPVRGPLPGNPPDPDQVCQECISRLGKP